MNRFALIAAPLMVSCSAFAQPPVPSVSPVKLENLEATAPDPVMPADADESMSDDVRDALASLSDDDAAATIDATVLGDTGYTQGGLVYGNRTAPGATVSLSDGAENSTAAKRVDVAVDSLGYFVFGFGRDHGEKATLYVTYPDGEVTMRELDIEPVAWRESRITVEPSKANPYKPEDLEKIADDQKLKASARARSAKDALWVDGFQWPAEGCVSSRFGYRRIVNGSPRRYHSGVDVAAPDGMSPMDYIGTSVYAPADGIVRLANSNMFFEGGLIFIDHGQGLWSYLMHMSSVDVAVGQRLKQGDMVGKIGMTGRVTGPHLHWSLKWQDRLLNPETTVAELPACTD